LLSARRQRHPSTPAEMAAHGAAGGGVGLPTWPRTCSTHRLAHWSAAVGDGRHADRLPGAASARRSHGAIAGGRGGLRDRVGQDGFRRLGHDRGHEESPRAAKTRFVGSSRARGALRFNGMDPHHLGFYDAMAPDQPQGGQRGWTMIDAGQRLSGPCDGLSQSEGRHRLDSQPLGLPGELFAGGCRAPARRAGPSAGDSRPATHGVRAPVSDRESLGRCANVGCPRATSDTMTVCRPGWRWRPAAFRRPASQRGAGRPVEDAIVVHRQRVQGVARRGNISRGERRRVPLERLVAQQPGDIVDRSRHAGAFERLLRQRHHEPLQNPAGGPQLTAGVLADASSGKEGGAPTAVGVLQLQGEVWNSATYCCARWNCPSIGCPRFARRAIA